MELIRRRELFLHCATRSQLFTVRQFVFPRAYLAEGVESERPFSLQVYTHAPLRMLTVEPV